MTSKWTGRGQNAPVNLVLGDLRVIDTEAGTVRYQAMAHIDGRGLTCVSSILRASMYCQFRVLPY